MACLIKMTTNHIFQENINEMLSDAACEFAHRLVFHAHIPSSYFRNAQAAQSIEGHKGEHQGRRMLPGWRQATPIARNFATQTIWMLVVLVVLPVEKGLSACMRSSDILSCTIHFAHAMSTNVRMMAAGSPRFRSPMSRPTN